MGQFFLMISIFLQLKMLKNAGDEIRTRGPLQDKALNLAPLTRLGYPCNKRRSINEKYICCIFYSVIASTGHSSTQVPQSIQVSASTVATSSTDIASMGQTSAHDPQPVHVSLSIVTAILCFLHIV